MQITENGVKLGIGLLILIIMAVRTGLDPGGIWTHFTSWTVTALGIYWTWAGIGAVESELRLMIMLPILRASAWMVAIAVVFMTYMEAKVLRDAEADIGKPLTYAGNFGLHGWTLLMLEIDTTIVIEDILRMTVLKYYTVYTQRNTLNLYYAALLFTGVVVLFTYYSWFDPSVYYGVDYVDDTTVIAVSIATFASVLGLHWKWLQWPRSDFVTWSI